MPDSACQIARRSGRRSHGRELNAGNDIQLLYVARALHFIDRMKLRIGEWVACTDTDTIRCNDAFHKLERRAMETLVVLGQRAGEVVKKDELIEAVWGRVAVSDHSVAMVISQLRRALKDDARAPRYIETITKRGYRLIVPCELVAEVRTYSNAVRRKPRRFVMPTANAVMLMSAGVTLAGIGALSAMLLF
jgi:DNA-binding winged helix-turn-helix (wHTH) protein